MTTRSALVMSLCLLGASGLMAKENPEFIWLSDIHFNPLADPKLADQLAEARVDEWAQILASSQPEQFSGFTQDTNWPLLTSALGAIQRLNTDAPFTVVTGDIFVHHFREKFDGAAKEHDDAAYERFTVKTMQFLAGQLGNLAPGTPILFAPGNNDGDCGDYALQPNGAFLRDSSPIVAKMLGTLSDDTSEKDWTSLGSYSVANPGVKHGRVIALNSVYFSPRYKNSCGAKSDDPARQELQWLRGKLAEAKKNKDKVWLVFHIPPGVDGYSTSHPKGGGPQTTVFMWKPEYTEEFQRILREYHDTVTVSLAGHEHVDDFRLIGESLVLLAPGLSPNVGQNPAFRIVSFKANGTLSDATTYYLSNLDDVLEKAAPEWKLEFGYDGIYGMNQLDFKSFSKLDKDIESKPDIRKRWTTFYSVSNPKAKNITEETFPALFCANGNATDSDFKACLGRLQQR
jgi:hypothetical protein